MTENQLTKNLTIKRKFIYYALILYEKNGENSYNITLKQLKDKMPKVYENINKQTLLTWTYQYSNATLREQLLLSCPEKEIPIKITFQQTLFGNTDTDKKIFRRIDIFHALNEYEKNTAILYDVTIKKLKSHNPNIYKNLTIETLKTWHSQYPTTAMREQLKVNDPNCIMCFTQNSSIKYPVSGCYHCQKLINNNRSDFSV